MNSSDNRRLQIEVYAGSSSDPNVVDVEDWDLFGAVWLPPEDVERFQKFVRREPNVGLDFTHDHHPAAFAADRYHAWALETFDVDLAYMLSPEEVQDFATKLAAWLCTYPEGPVAVQGKDTGVSVDEIRAMSIFAEISVRQNLWWSPMEPTDVPDWE